MVPPLNASSEVANGILNLVLLPTPRTIRYTAGIYAPETLEPEVEIRPEAIPHAQGYVYRQLLRVPPVIKTGMTNPESFSFNGATWFSPDGGYERRKFADFLEDGKVDKQTASGWIA